jgi:hypothetical protein
MISAVQKGTIMITLDGIDNAQSLEAVVAGPGGANRLFIYTGVAIFRFKGNDGSWLRDTLTFEVGRVFAPGQVLDSLATASLNSIRNENTAVNAGWAVDRITAPWNPVEQRIKVRADLAVSDSDGYLLRMGYQVTVLARV